MIQEYSKGLMIALAIVFLVLPVVFSGLRVWAKRLSCKNLGVDDYLSLSALVICVACCITQVVAAVKGRLGQHQIINPDGTIVVDDPGFIVYEKAKFAVNCLTIVGLGLIKASILHFYKSIFSIRPFKIAVYVMLALVWIWTAGFFFANLFTCYPITPFVDLYFGSDNCMDATTMWLSAVVTDVVLDFAILLMPIPMVLRLHLPLQQRIGVLGMFLLGSSVCAASITRTYTYFYIAFRLKSYNDLTYFTSPVFFWAVIEQSLAVVSASLPTLRPIWLHFRPRNLNTTKSYGYGSGISGSRKLDSNGHMGHFELSSRQDKGPKSTTRAAMTDASSLEELILPSNADESRGVQTSVGVGNPDSTTWTNEGGITVQRTMETTFSVRESHHV